MLPALLGTHLNIPGGCTFKTRKQHMLLEPLGQNMLHTQLVEVQQLSPLI